MEKYPYTKLEKKWQTYWDKNKTFCVTEDKSFPKNKRLYVLDMFPYPSGAGLHVGHPEGYTATDVYSRFKRMNGYNVLHPMGFDSFGLPAENYAIQTGTHPAITTSKNIANFTRQIKSLGFSYDWSREVITSDPKYYKWTQFIFKKLYEKGLAYESEEPINFCPSCKTGLANEEVHDGKCERCGSQVVHKPIRQWILKITSYAERLLEDLDTLDWPDSVKEMQKNWIGKSIGANVDFKAENGSKITVFTTRPDTLFGATYLVVSPEYKDIKKLVAKEKEKEVLKYCEEASKKSDLERTDLAKTKTGVFSGSYAINPLNNKKIPIWVADYVLSSYGTGAIMAVPAHDDRDWEFAKKFNLPIIAVLEGGGDCKSAAYTGDGKHINSEFLNGLNKQEAIDKVIEFLEKNKIGQKTINYKLRDWIFSRQRFWGEPIPLVHCPKCGTVPLEDKDLPLELPKTDSFKPSEDGSSPLSNIKGFVNAKCPKCGSKATRETNTMPQWAGSCWYYLRYLDPLNNKEFCSKEKEKYWMPVALYVGGAEHAVLHLLYARFWHKVLYDLGLVSTKEPFQKLVNQGLITAFAYQKKDKALVPVDTVEEKGDKFFIKETHEEVNRVIAKMSKSLKNVINPDDIIKDHGADALRLYELFLGPLEVSKPWSTTGIAGIDRFLERSWALHQAKKITDKKPTEDLYKLLHKTIQKVTQDIDTLNFNTGISSLMILLNAISKEDELNKSVYESYILLLSPYAPHLCEELWERLGHKTSIAKAPWPQVDKKALTDNEVNISVQINSKVRSNIKVRKDLSNDEVLKLAKSDDKVKKWLDGATIVKEIVVPNRTVNIVVKK